MPESGKFTFSDPDDFRGSLRLEQDLIYALVTCLAGRPDRQRVAPKHYRADIMRQFEQALAATSERPPHMPELCKAIGVPERTLRLCCTEFLGMAPTQYFRLQRLGMVRSALRICPHPNRPDELCASAAAGGAIRPAA
jgi:hypothetical protein